MDEYDIDDNYVCSNNEYRIDDNSDFSVNGMK